MFFLPVLSCVLFEERYWRDLVLIVNKTAKGPAWRFLKGSSHILKKHPVMRIALHESWQVFTVTSATFNAWSRVALWLLPLMGWAWVADCWGDKPLMRVKAICFKNHSPGFEDSYEKAMYVLEDLCHPQLEPINVCIWGQLIHAIYRCIACGEARKTSKTEEYWVYNSTCMFFYLTQWYIEYTNSVHVFISTVIKTIYHAHWFCIQQNHRKFMCIFM